jgi:protein involved in temperature-dependent protein secretion
MALHHPHGALKGSSSAYAHDWEKWQGIMSHVFHLLQNELRACIERSKIRSKRNQEPTISTDLVILTVEIYKQVHI